MARYAPGMDDHPVVLAELVAEFDGAVGTVPGRAHAGAWTVRDAADGVLLLDRELRIHRRFPIPERVRERGRFDWDVHSSGRWAVFAGIDRTECIGVDGDVVWEIDHRALLNVDGDPEEASALFHPNGDELWAFVPVTEDGTDKVQRWILSLSDITTTNATSADEDSGIGRHVLFHPDGRHTGSVYFDGHQVGGSWWRWDDDDVTLVSEGIGRPIAVHPDGTAWLGKQFRTLYINPFESPEETDDDEYDPYDAATESAWDAYSDGFFLNQNFVLASTVAHRSQLLLDVKTLQVSAQVLFPSAFADEQITGIAGVGDGTWVTTSRRSDTQGARLRHWRLASEG